MTAILMPQAAVSYNKHKEKRRNKVSGNKIQISKNIKNIEIFRCR